MSDAAAHDDSYRFHEYSGGCQCGAVRWHATEVGDNPHICHCRMCQKAMGNLFADLVRIKAEHLTWTRGQPSEFNSSDLAARGFCRDCGTPLYYRSLSGPNVSMTIASFDEPHAIPLRYEMGLEGRHPSLRPLPGVEQVGTTEEADGAEAVARISNSNHQHPDHDTAEWPPHH
jgi:hypothetical protein